MKKGKIKALLVKPVFTAIIAIIAGFIVGAIVLLAAGYNPLQAYAALFTGIFSNPRYIATMIIKATPLIFTGVSVAFAFKTGLFNIGAEGQYIVGAIAAVFAGYFLHLPAWLHIPVVILCAIVASAIWGGIVGLLKARFGIHEVISSIMLNWIALYLQNYLITMEWLKKPGTESSFEVLPSARITFLGEWKMSEEGLAWCKSNGVLGEVLLKTDVNFGIVIAVVVAILIWFILKRTTLGYQLRAVGFNQDAAEFAGINVKKNTVVSMAIAGAIAGLAGCVAIIGANPFRISTLSVMEGFGFDGISVALIAGSSPLGCILSALLLAGLRYGGQSIQSQLGVPSEVISIMIGTIVFFIAIATVVPMIINKIEKRREKK